MLHGLDYLAPRKKKNQDNELNLHAEAFGHTVSHHYLSVKISGVWSTCKTVLRYERDNLFKEKQKKSNKADAGARTWDY